MIESNKKIIFNMEGLTMIGIKNKATIYDNTPNTG